jgi:hypothetical protein
MNPESQPQPSTWQRSSTRRFLAWLTSPRTLRRFLILAAWAISLIALFYGVVDWSGRRAWNAFRKDYESRSASLDLQSYIPKEIPDADNFAATPPVASFMATDDTNQVWSNDHFSRADKLIEAVARWELEARGPLNAPDTGAAQVSRVPGAPPKKKHIAPPRHLTDLAQWEKAFDSAAANPKNHDPLPPSEGTDAQSRAQAAPAILRDLADDTAPLDTLREASRRPGSRYPIKYKIENPWATLLPHLARVKQTCRRLHLRASAELALGQSDKALADAKLLFYMADSLETEPFVVSHLVRLACFHTGVDAVWEGLAQHAWNPEQLQELQRQFLGYNFIADIQNPMRCEHTMGIVFIEGVEKKGLGYMRNILDGSDPVSKELHSDVPSTLVGLIVPSGWYDQEKIQYATYAGKQLSGTIDASTKRVYPKEIAARQEELAIPGNFASVILHHQVAARLNLPSLMNCFSKTAAGQVTSDQAAIACALERYRLANQEFPENLDALSPQFMSKEEMPRDPFSGEQYKYRRNSDATFTLYSIGWNEKDDNGAPGERSFDTKSGDWVW